MKVLCGLFLVFLVLSSCSFYEDNYNIYDDDMAIINNRNRYIKRGSSQNSRGNMYSHRVNGSFTGIDSIRSIDSSTRLDVDLSITSGRFKLVLVGDNEVILVTDESVRQTFQFPEIEGGSYRLKMVGDGATFNLEVRF